MTDAHISRVPTYLLQHLTRVQAERVILGPDVLEHGVVRLLVLAQALAQTSGTHNETASAQKVV